MTFTLRKSKKNLILSAVITALVLILGIIFQLSAVNVIITSILTAAVLLIKIEFSDKIASGFIFLIFSVTALIIFILMQYTITAGLSSLPVILFFLNVLLIFLFEILIFGIIGNVKASILSITVFSVALGLIDYLTVQARSLELFISDALSVGVALGVAGSYSFYFSRTVKAALFYAVIFIMLISLVRFPKRRYLPAVRITSVCCGIVFSVLIAFASASGFGVKSLGIKDSYWRYQGSQYNGFYVRILRSAYATLVSRPEGYSPSRLIELLENYKTQKNEPGDKTPVTGTDGHSTSESPVTLPPVTDGSGQDDEPKKKLPNVIVIMDETLSDLQAVNKYLYDSGYTDKLLETDVDPLEYIHSIPESEHFEKGWALSSVFGGNTANSEFEFLTGHSMAFFPAGSVVYNLYLNEKNCFSLVNNLSSFGYHTVGMHPENPTNWSRNRVYGFFGFDETSFIDDFADAGEDDYYRGHVSDSAAFKKIEEMFESYRNDSEDPYFAFIVTMMNHGGYKSENFNYTVDVTDEFDMSEAEEYFSSIKKTDEAIKEIIDYYTASGEETVILIFGDHQPSISNSAFYRDYFGDREDSSSPIYSKYIIPYYIWANFDFRDAPTEETVISEDSLTSINYLSLRIYDICGIEKTEYLDFIEDVQKDYPVLTGMGFFNSEKEFVTVESVSEEKYSLLQIYKYLQYNCIFEESDDKLEKWFVPSGKSITDP